MNQLVSDMASVSAMRTNKVTLEKEVFDLSSVAASILASYQLLQEQESYDFVFNTPKDCLVYADKNKIEQVISNAVKYTPSGEIEIYCEKPLTLCIRDTGIGIAAEDIPRIFEKGYTGCNGRLDKKASGIGLYLCKRICRKLGHNISAESGEKGTTIKISLEQREIEIE